MMEYPFGRPFWAVMTAREGSVSSWALPKVWGYCPRNLTTTCSRMI
jgi:hypothetical protein